MFKKLALALGLCLATSTASAQTCPTRPVGDNSNACASTAFVGAASGAALPSALITQFYIGTGVAGAAGVGSTGTPSCNQWRRTRGRCQRHRSPSHPRRHHQPALPQPYPTSPPGNSTVVQARPGLHNTSPQAPGLSPRCKSTLAQPDRRWSMVVLWALRPLVSVPNYRCRRVPTWWRNLRSPRTNRQRHPQHRSLHRLRLHW